MLKNHGAPRFTASTKITLKQRKHQCHCKNSNDNKGQKHLEIMDDVQKNHLLASSLNIAENHLFFWKKSHYKIKSISRGARGFALFTVHLTD